ncbi:iron ABC transporter permease [Ktedonosporobacter rubrisoli]|uniref:Iron ABC transporter permease n=1 Tax=Ktedonosporobacter rubrisoli TaxID=2509675 RepID=A0A4P6JSU9_KTERU|nr:iron ABC transporter permease [Ktedonosporobacter rubrisoli]QBD78365.1 iron ABC transporter permease [Ktedonosporobacter rubrisoli]
MQRWKVIRPSWLPFSYRVKVRVPLMLLLLLVAICAALVITISVGEYIIPPQAVLETLLGNGSQSYSFIVLTLRLPRVLVALLVGMAMAASGAILQGLTRNPLASPDIIGISNGASLTAVALLTLFSAAPISLLPLVAFGGACAAAILIYLLAWNGGSSPTRLILVGVGLSAVASSLVQILIANSQVIVVNQALIWLAGSVYGRTWEHFWSLLPWLVIFLPLALVMTRHLDALHLGDDLARSLGSQVERQRIILLIASVALAGSSVAIAGTIGFVGLMAPHIARMLVGPSHGGLLPVATLVGGLLVILADLIGRTIFAPIEIPCGVITAAVGAPYFIWLLIRSRNL